MDPDPRADTLMHDDDGDIVTSTEFTQITAGPSSFGSVSGLPVANGTFSSTKSATPALKGAGLKRDGDVFDHDLTQLKDAPRPPKFKALPYASAQTGLVYDVRMRFHVEAIPTEDDVHPEDPRRIHAIFEAFVQAGLAWRESTSGPLTDYYMGPYGD
jgi:histone deacetylase 6